MKDDPKRPLITSDLQAWYDECDRASEAIERLHRHGFALVYPGHADAPRSRVQATAMIAAAQKWLSEHPNADEDVT